MAVDVFLKIDGIDGECKDDKHKDEIDILAWSWGLSNQGNATMGGGSGAGKVQPQDISYTKYVDKSSPNMMLAVSNGKHIKEATLVARKAGEKPLEYFKIKMVDIMVTSYSTGGSSGEDRITENISLSFAEADVTYQEQDDKTGDKKGGEVKYKYNYRENK